MKIKKLTLYSNKIEQQKEFYSGLFGLSMSNNSVNSFEINIGKSWLEFKYRPNSTPYHYAINISSNQYKDALQWLKQRVELLKDGQNEIIDFPNWNAKAIYFYDKDKNIVEFISRKNLNINFTKPFTSNSLLEISEIGVPSTDIELQFKILKKCNLKIYDGNFDKFCAVGDEHGLFILINNERKTWFPPGDKAFSSEFQISFIEKEKYYDLEYYNEVFNQELK